MLYKRVQVISLDIKCQIRNPIFATAPCMSSSPGHFAGEAEHNISSKSVNLVHYNFTGDNKNEFKKWRFEIFTFPSN